MIDREHDLSLLRQARLVWISRGTIYYEARPLPERGFAGVMRAPFSLLFRSASKVLLPQQIYRLKNATLGILDIFLVPVARDKEGIIYQAIFN